QAIVSLTNHSDSAVSFLKWETAFERELADDLFMITPTGRGAQIFQPLEFTGRVFRRQAPDADDLITLGSGETLTAEIPLGDFYNVPADGRYRVTYNGDALMRSLSSTRSGATDGSILNGYAPVPMESNSVTTSMTQSVAEVRARPPTYNLCSANQESVLITANDAAETMANESLTSLQGLSAEDRLSSPRYDEWFGAYTDNRFNRVVEIYTAIDGALANEVMNYDCSCDIEGVIAYVYKNSPFDIYLCPVFWESPLFGAYSQAGTIVHEVSHFTVIADTDDVVYGQSLAANLADTDPDTAITNADNVSFFSENDPVIPMTGEIDTPTTDNYLSLSLDTAVSGSVLADESIFYQVTGTDRVVLESTSGDADLEVYSDAARNNLLCSSYSVSAIDDCIVNVASTVYIRVFGYTDASYTLIAEASDGVVDTGGTVDLALNDPVTADVGLEELDVYRVENASSISVTINSGDADLYVFDSPEFTVETLICESAFDTVDAPVETCQVPPNQELYVVVYGYLASNYTIEATGGGNSGNAELIPMAAGDVYEGSVAEGEFLFFEVTGARRMVLESLSGDADIGVFTDSEFTDATCISQTVDAVESCDVETTTAYVAVLGYTAATFRLTADDDADVDPETDGGTSSGTTGTTTGGTTGTTGDTTGGTTGTTTGDTTGGSTEGNGTTTESSDGGLGTDGSTPIPVDDGESGGGGGGAAGGLALALAGLLIARRRKSAVRQ
nr:hypothetical protein [Gammaproteobacteria bacterium]